MTRMSSNKCDVCGKTVYLMEERRAINKVYHISCFKCGGKNSDGCRKQLSLDAYAVHADEPYCRACYGKNFGPAGVRQGVTHRPSLDRGDSPATAEIVSETGGGVKAALAKLKDKMSEEEQKRVGGR